MSVPAFQAWAAERGIGRSVAYPNSPSLTFRSPAATWYPYRRPEAEPMSTFAERAVRVAAGGQGFWLYPPARDGSWSLPTVTELSSLAPLNAAIRELGVAESYMGAAFFTTGEQAQVIRLMTAALDRADCFWELAVIPTHGQCVLASDEDGDLIGNFPDEARCASYTAALRRAGWREPEEPDPHVSATDPWLEIGGT